ncbi:hypothetical protein NECAME_13310 [Necator americanus]|uniref:Uncharacterized protein n=1 Tax=Necator americanus TaxID=51031 RepID=W2SZ32_NECAM|nr:hypothetical protein NECAME_13310 [Necator americanus]ETN73932.1 hypothetical protein NECAME_13310 [Necator americanus]
MCMVNKFQWVYIMQSMFTLAFVCTLTTMLLAQQVVDDVTAEKRVRSFAFAKRSPYRQFAFAKRSEDDDEEEVEKRARFAFAKRSPYRQFAFAKRASPYGFAFAKRGYSSFA